MRLSSNFLICLVGLPASGKSVFAQKIKDILGKRFDNFKVTIIDPDHIRDELTPGDFNHEEEKLVRENNLEQIFKALKKGEIVISDDLNYYSSMRHNLKEIAESLNLKLFIINISTPLEICIEWNEKRGIKIPNEVIQEVHKKFDYFNRYNWDKPLIEIDLSKVGNINEVIEETIRSIISKLKESKQANKQVKVKSKYSKSNNEKLEQITRQIVGNFLKDPINYPLKEKILDLRKKFVKNNLNKSLSEAKVYKTFLECIEKEFELKMSNKMLK